MINVTIQGEKWENVRWSLEMSGVVNFRCGIVHIIVFLSPLHSQKSREILLKRIQIDL